MSTQIGRVQLFTDEPEITYENVIDVVREAYNDYIPTINKIDYLLRYEAGEQPLKREKNYRKDINIECDDNVANEVTEFNLGYKWSNTITLVQCGKNNKKKMDGISMLNKCYDLQGIKAKQQQLGYFVEISSLGYTYVESNKDFVAEKTEIDDEYEDGEYPFSQSPFKIEVLDPRYAFVVRSAYYMDNRVVLGVTFRRDRKGNRHFTCFTKDRRFEILNLTEIVNGEVVPEEKRWQHKLRSGEENPLHKIPINEWSRSCDRMGSFERQIPEMNNLNILVSDFSNDVCQNTQAIWHCNDVDFPEEVIVDENGNEIKRVKKPKTNEFLQTFTTPDGKTPFVNPLAVAYDYNGMLNNIITRRSLILQKCHVPQRNDNSGGSTGIAMSDASGWSDAENSANRQQALQETCKMQEVEVVLAAIKNCVGFPEDNPMMRLRPSDMQANIKRQKTYEMTVKTNAASTLIGKGFALEDVVNAIPMFDDNNQVIARSGEGVRKYQEVQVFKLDTSTNETEEKRPFADYSDQEGNSPNIGSLDMNLDEN